MVEPMNLLMEASVMRVSCTRCGAGLSTPRKPNSSPETFSGSTRTDLMPCGLR